MKKLYVGMLLTAFFCSADAMEAEVQLPHSSSGEQRAAITKAFAEMSDDNGDAYRAMRNILIELRNWYALIPEKKKINPDAVSTVDKDLSNANKLLKKSKLSEKNVQKFRCWTLNATEVLYALHHQQEKRDRAALRQLQYFAKDADPY